MLDMKEIESRPEEYKVNLKRRGDEYLPLIDEAISLNSERKGLTTKVENLRASMNQLAKEIGPLKKSGEHQAAGIKQKEVQDFKKELELFDDNLKEVKAKLRHVMLIIPNLLLDEVPSGNSEDDNILLETWGDNKDLAFSPRDHVDLGESLGGIDFQAASKMVGARFAVFKGEIARLERALINFMLDTHHETGHEEVLTPFMVNGAAMEGSGQFPKFKDDVFKIEGRDWYLIPTSEVSLVNLKREEIIQGGELPLKYCSFSPCFRSEAGSYGRDTRGLIRMHQFHKIELVYFVASDEGEESYKQMLASAKSILEKLELPHRLMSLCTGDLGFHAQKTVDLEVWLPSQKKYREISSVSLCGDFQSRRADIRYRCAKTGKLHYPLTLNGSGLAVGRTLVAILENYQDEEGNIRIPEVLKKYMNGASKISKRA